MNYNWFLLRSINHKESDFKITFSFSVGTNYTKTHYNNLNSNKILKQTNQPYHLRNIYNQ